MNRRPLIIGVGTSPIMLLVAIRLARRGERVLLYDEAVRPGGAWAVDSVFGFENVETGVHLMENRSEISSLLSQIPGLVLQLDSCVTVVCGHFLPMRIGRILFHAAVGLNGLRRSTRERASRAFESAWRALLSLQIAFKYPSEGAGGMIDALTSEFRDSGGEIRLGVRIDQVRITGRKLFVTTRNGNVCADQVLMSSRAFSDLELEGHKVDWAEESYCIHNAVIRVRSLAINPNSYFECLGDVLVKRVRNVGIYARPAPAAGEHLFAIQYRTEKAQSDSELSHRLLQSLIRLRILPQEAEICDLVRTSVILRTLSRDRSKAALDAAHGQLRIIETTDFAERLKQLGRGGYA